VELVTLSCRCAGKRPHFSIFSLNEYTIYSVLVCRRYVRRQQEDGAEDCKKGPKL
jgi:hypothetical protein